MTRRDLKQLSGQRARVRKQMERRGFASGQLSWPTTTVASVRGAVLARQLARRRKWRGHLPDAAFVQTPVAKVDVSQAQFSATAERLAREFVASVCLATWIRRQNLGHVLHPLQRTRAGLT